MDWSLAIAKIDPAKQYNQTGDDYASIIWIGSAIPEQDLLAAYISYLNSDKKVELRQLIIDLSEDEKSKYITLVPGKSTAYIQKEAETIAYKNGERDKTKLPIMNLAAEINSRTLADQYALWLPSVENWPLIGGRIEAKYDFQMTRLDNTIFSDDSDVDTFISEIDLRGIE